jgi:hypothetical protein
MGIAAVGPKPRTSKPAPGHRIFPYVLRGLRIDRPNHYGTRIRPHWTKSVFVVSVCASSVS